MVFRATLGLAGCLVGALTLTACTSSSIPDAAQTTPTALISPAPDSPELQSIAVAPLPGEDNDTPTHYLSIPPGWRAEEWVKVDSPSAMVWTPAGDLLVSSSATGKVFRIHPSPGEPPQVSVLIEGLRHPYGIDVSQASGTTTVVVASEDKVIAFELVGGKIGKQWTLIDNLPTGGVNPYKSLKVSPDGTQVYFGVGSSTDRDLAEAKDPRRGVIMSVPLTPPLARAARTTSPIMTVATGVRNALGLDFAPDGTLYAAISGVQDPPFPYHAAIDRYSDGYGRTGTTWAIDNPADPVTRVRTGDSMGWPFCMPAADAPRTVASPADGPLEPTSDLPTAQATDPVDLAYVPDPITNPNRNIFDCTSLPMAQAALPAHSEPTNLHFLFDSAISTSMTDGALVIAHGSSSDALPRTPGVYYVPWDNTTQRLGAPRLLVGGFQNPNGSRWARSTDAVPGPEGDGRLYLSDDMNGMIYRLTPPA